MRVTYKIIFFIKFLSLSLEVCHKKCKTCFEDSTNDNDMKCISCKESDEKILFNTSNCVHIVNYPNYYEDTFDEILYPCSLFSGEHCFSCTQFGQCLSCNPGFEYDFFNNKCVRCESQNKFPIILFDIYGYSFDKCDYYITVCSPLINGNIICPDEAPFFNPLMNSCHEFEFKQDLYEDDICIISNKEKNNNEYIYVNQFDFDIKNYPFPSYNLDNSGCLLIELSLGEVDEDLFGVNYIAKKNKTRKFYFYNSEGRGLFNKINDEYENVIEANKNVVRYYSISLFIKSKNSDEYRFFLNFENQEYILELLDIKTGELSADNIFDIFSFDSKPIVDNDGESVFKNQLFELN